MTTTLLQRVESCLDRYQLGSPATCIVVAVSGGPDSLCLLHLLWRLAGPALHVAHLDHGFRGAQSAAEAQQVAATAHAWGLPATIDYCDVPALAHTTGQNHQAAARAARYTFLARVAHQQQAAAIAVAHQADDQAETVLLHLLHGAGPAGLGGMREATPWHTWRPADAPDQANPTDRPLLLRPLLGTSRAEIEAYCHEHQLTPSDDPSNASPYYTRSRIRADLLPTLASYNPQISAALGRTAQVCADDHDYIQTQLDAAWPALVSQRPAALHFRASAWQTLHPALQRYALRRAARQLTGSDDLSYEQIEAGRRAPAHGPGYQQTLAHGLLLRVEHHGFLLIHTPTYDANAPATPDMPQLAVDQLPLTIPGSTPLSAAWELHASSTPPNPGGDRWQTVLDAAALDGPLHLRRRQPGDRFHPAGAPGSRRLQDFFVDHKVPRELRAAWPILATPQHIVWVAGFPAEVRFQATAQTRQQLRVALVRREHARGHPAHIDHGR